MSRDSSRVSPKKITCGSARKITWIPGRPNSGFAHRFLIQRSGGASPMLRYFRESLAEYLQVLVSEDSSRGLAAGLALGIALGLVPTMNLIALALAVVVFSTRANITVAMGSAFLVSWLGTWIDPHSHQLGHFLLTLEPLRPMWTEIYHWPLAPWSGFNNTVVLGNLLIGLAAAYPIYRVSEPIIRRLLPSLSKRLKQSRWFRWLADVAEDDANQADSKEESSSKNQPAEEQDATESDEPETVRDAPEVAAEEPRDAVDSKEHERRAA
ncbi:MAG: TIGR03546 family protein [Planctomycetales bacterium]